MFYGTVCLLVGAGGIKNISQRILLPDTDKIIWNRLVSCRLILSKNHAEMFTIDKTAV